MRRDANRLGHNMAQDSQADAVGESGLVDGFRTVGYFTPIQELGPGSGSAQPGFVGDLSGLSSMVCDLWQRRVPARKGVLYVSLRTIPKVPCSIRIRSSS